MTEEELTKTLELIFEVVEARKLAVMFCRAFADMPVSILDVFPELELLPEDHWLFE